MCVLKSGCPSQRYLKRAPMSSCVIVTQVSSTNALWRFLHRARPQATSRTRPHTKVSGRCGQPHAPFAAANASQPFPGGFPVCSQRLLRGTRGLCHVWQQKPHGLPNSAEGTAHSPCFPEQLLTFPRISWSPGPEHLGVGQFHFNTNKMNSYSVDDTFLL